MAPIWKVGGPLKRVQKFESSTHRHFTSLLGLTFRTINVTLGMKRGFGKMPKKQQDQKKHDIEYLAFLKKRIDSKNYKNNVSKEEYEKTKAKYEKLKLKMRLIS